jgi:aldose 1-epimerase
MNIHREVVGSAPGPEGHGEHVVESYHLDNGRGLSITVWTYGATLVEVLVPDAGGTTCNVVLRLPALDDYLDRARNPYVGSTVGRYCRSVANGSFVLDGVRHELDRNDGRHHVHGGTEGFDRRLWTARTYRDEDALTLELRLLSPAGDQGYPGAVDVRCRYRIDSGNRLTITFSATTTEPTVVGLTNHAFWNLAGQDRIDGHVLRLNSDRVVRFDEDLIPLAGPAADVLGSDLDFTTARQVGPRRLDNFFPLDDPAWAAELYDPDSGRLMRVSTDHPGVGVYSADGLAAPRTGLCLETGAWPDAPNRPDFPSVRLDPGQNHRHSTVYEFITRRATSRP